LFHKSRNRFLKIAHTSWISKRELKVFCFYGIFRHKVCEYESQKENWKSGFTTSAFQMVMPPWNLKKRIESPKLFQPSHLHIALNLKKRIESKISPDWGSFRENKPESQKENWKSGKSHFSKNILRPLQNLKKRIESLGQWWCWRGSEREESQKENWKRGLLHLSSLTLGKKWPESQKENWKR